MDLPGVDSLARPGILPFALPIVLFVLVLLLSARRGLRGTILVLAALLRTALLLGLLWFLAEPGSTSTEPLPARLEVHLDLSASVSTADRERFLDQLEGEIRSLLPREPDLEVEINGFAGRSRSLWRGPAGDLAGQRARLLAGEVIDSLDPLASRPSSSLAAATAGRRESLRLGRLIFSDGQLPPPDLVDPLEPTLVVGPPGRDERNVELLNLGLPTRIEADEPFAIVLNWSSTFAGLRPLVIEIDGEVRKTVDFDFEIGSGELLLEGEDLRLPTGRHRVTARLLEEDDESSDDLIAAIVEAVPPRRPLVISSAPAGTRAPAVYRALVAQELEPRMVAPEKLGPADIEERASLIVLDRVAPAAIGEDLSRRIADFVEKGGGLLLLPREDRDELLAWNRHKLHDLLPLAGLPEPRVEPDEKPERPPLDEDPGKKLSDPDPDKKKRKEVEAPTLVMLLVIDASASMKQGGRMRFAREGAIATLRKLHPEDRIGVIAYNDRPMEVVPVRQAGDRDPIERAIQRIEPDGSTDIQAALEFAQTTLDREEAGVKALVLLSDGYNRPFNVKAVASSLLASGISVTTVGVGSQFDVVLLTQIAKYGGGTGPIPARNPRQLPAVMVDVAARLIDRNSLRDASDARREKKEEDEIVRPETQIEPGKDRRDDSAFGEAMGEGDAAVALELAVARATSYLDGIPIDEGPPLFGSHRARARRAASTSLLADRKRPVLAHWRRGDGVVAMTAMPLEGDWARKLALWDAFPALVSQLARFCALDPSQRAFEIDAQLVAGSLLVEIVDDRIRGPATGWSFRSLAGAALAASEVEPGRYLVELPGEIAPPLFEFLALDPVGGEALPSACPVPPPAELAERGVDLIGLESWASALGGSVVADLRGVELLPPQRELETRRASAFGLGIAFALVLLFELVLKRLVVARSERG